MYDETTRTDGWRDLMSRLEIVRETLTNSLRRGKFDTAYNAGTTDDELRAMLWVLDKFIEIPAMAKLEYDSWRDRENKRLAPRQPDVELTRFMD